MKSAELKNKKITMATFKSFIKKSNELFVEKISEFDGMIDGLSYNSKRNLVKVSKENAIGFNGVYCVGSGRDYFTYFENDTHFGIEVYNSCGCAKLLTVKS